MRNLSSVPNRGDANQKASVMKSNLTLIINSILIDNYFVKDKMFHVKHQKRKGESEGHKVEKRGNCRSL